MGVCNKPNTNEGLGFLSYTLLIIDDNVVDTTIVLRKNRKIKLPDAIIAATALVHNMTLLRACLKI